MNSMYLGKVAMKISEISDWPRASVTFTYEMPKVYDIIDHNI